MNKSLDIDELAWKHVNRHPNDKSGHHLSVMHGRWGRTPTAKAIKRAEDIRAMVDPEFARELAYQKLKYVPLGSQYSGIRGRKATVCILDDPIF